MKPMKKLIPALLTAALTASLCVTPAFAIYDVDFYPVHKADHYEGNEYSPYLRAFDAEGFELRNDKADPETSWKTGITEGVRIGTYSIKSRPVSDTDEHYYGSLEVKPGFEGYFSIDNTSTDTDTCKDDANIEHLLLSAVGYICIAGDNSFQNASKLKDVIIEGRYGIGPGCFNNCPNLEKVTFTVDRDIYIDANAFQNCPKLTIYGPGGNDLEKKVRATGVPFVSTNGQTTPDKPAAPNVTGCSDWAKETITTAIRKDIVPGSLQSSYTTNITRQEMCNLLIQLLRQTDTSIPSGSNPFTDISDPDVTAAAALGIVNGVSANTFNPTGSITREQAATMLARFADLAGLKPTVHGPFEDEAEFSPWALEGIRKISAITDAVTGGPVMGGTSTRKFSPKGTFTREQAIATALRLANCLGVD